MNPHTVNWYMDLFRGRGDCYGSWEGGCIRQRLTRERFIDHLEGNTLIGVYPAFNNKDGETVTVWGCTDIDYDSHDDAWAIHDALKAVGIYSWVEKTVKGWHVWAFATELVPASHMRRMFLAAHQVAGVKAVEVNPKQEKLLHTQVGNYVRLPYPGERLVRRMMTRDNQQIPLDGFLEIAHATRNTPVEIATVAAYWREPKQTTYTSTPPSYDMQLAAARLDRVGKAIFTYGPMPDRDRSTTLLRLAHKCAEAGLALEDCLLLMEDADLRWGKFLTRPNGQRELLKLVNKAYGAQPGASTSG